MGTDLSAMSGFPNDSWAGRMISLPDFFLMNHIGEPLCVKSQGPGGSAPAFIAILSQATIVIALTL